MGTQRAASFSLRGLRALFPEIRNMNCPAPLFTQPPAILFLLLAVALAGLFVTFILPWFRFFPARDPALVPRQHRHLFDDP